MKKLILAMTILGLAAAALVPTAKADGYYGRYYGRGGYYYGAPYRAYCAPRPVAAWPLPAPIVCAPRVVFSPPVLAVPPLRIGLPLPPLPVPFFHGFFRGPFGFFHHGHR